MHTNPEVLVLLALGEDSATQAERAHVETCPTCTHEVAELAHLAGVGRMVPDATPLEKPSPEVWRRIQAELGFTITSPPVDDSSPLAAESPSTPATAGLAAGPSGATAEVHGADAAESPTGTSRRRRALALALAAALVLIAGIGIGLGWNSLSRPTPTVVAEAQLTPASPAWDGSTGEAVVERRSDGQQFIVMHLETPRPVPGTRVVWLMDSTGKKMQTVGILTSADGEWSVPVNVDLEKFPVIDVSDEPFDGNPAHSGESIARGTLNV